MDTSPPAKPRPASYHHGALREALLAAAERLLEAGGMPALTLRAVAREAGVSHAAPAHHFRDLTGLLTALAAVGYRRLAGTFAAATDAAGTDPTARLLAMGRAYVGFARAYPGLFLLMFRSERLDMQNPELCEATGETARALREAIEARAPGVGAIDAIGRAAAVWSLVHGFSLLLIDQRLKGLLAAMPEHQQNPDALLEAVLRVTNFVPA